MPSSWVLTKEKGASVAAWRASGTHRRTVESLDFACEEHTYAGLLLERGREGGWKTIGGVAWFPAPVPACDPVRASEHASPAHLTSQLHAGVRAATNKARAVLW
uniref:Uncharacterized protein n=1 Tax=Rangifer tarandus platyrhynchus TaxID=3082113 RepID=A0ACB0FD24_RANTA|nr:unnamed protein product [Rangifer tarandus platyrhynchus]